MGDSWIEVPGAPWPPPTLEQFLAETADADPLRWFMPGLVPADAIGIVSGPPKTYKTYLIQMIARCLATGKDHGPVFRLNPDLAGRPLKVWFLEFEGARGATADSWQWIENGCGWKCSTENIYFMHRYFHFSLSDPDWIQRSCQFVHDHEIDIVFVDTFAEARGTIKSETDSEAVRPALNGLRQIRGATRNGEGSAFYVHHTRKPSDEDLDADIDNELRGTSSLAGGYYIHHAIRRTPDGRSGVHLTSRSKNDDERYYSLDWQFRTKVKDRAQQKVTLDIAEWKIGKEDTYDLAQLEAYSRRMRPGHVYTKRQLCDLWVMPVRVVEAFTAQLASMGSVQGTERGWKKAGG